MNNKPVAWTDGHFYVSFDKTGICSIPLYTHPVNTCKHGVDDGACKECYQEATNPVKELTDEEIWKCHDETDSNNWVIDFARAILRKASEK